MNNIDMLLMFQVRLTGHMNANGDSHIVAILKISLIILKSMVFRKTLKAPQGLILNQAK
ncbi:hypothetical protein L246_39180 [Salmonella enterica subsp. enterica serovar Worthington str. BCH-5715]|nr:hypothetical protein L246_39180 [Salmonella enterica subsp. enterica serovar Worthington str. BCH-5715]KAF0779861.1 hypothetical protein L243_30080 [Salmonella enterica subsp. enterica serovar Worthington str. BCH-3008]